MLLLLEILGGRNGQVLRQNGHTWVPSRTFTEIPVSVVPCELNLGGQKGFLVDFCFVQAEDVRVLLQEILSQIALGNHRPDPIHIPTRNRQAFGRVPSAILPSVSGGGHFWDLKTLAEIRISWTFVLASSNQSTLPSPSRTTLFGRVLAALLSQKYNDLLNHNRKTARIKQRNSNIAYFHQEKAKTHYEQISMLFYHLSSIFTFKTKFIAHLKNLFLWEKYKFLEE